MGKFFAEIDKIMGFGGNRMPMLENGQVDTETFSQMVDLFLENGFNYFDTARGYLEGRSELALRECLVRRHPRESFLLTHKLSDQHFKRQEDILPLFESHLAACGVDYFDFYLMHAQDARIFRKFKDCRAYETAMVLREKGRIRHLGISFHDQAAVLDQILTEYPQIEVVQIQLNYADYESPSVQSRLCYEVCEKHNKPVFVMEPVKGGTLINLPEAAQKVLDGLSASSPQKPGNASFALRFAAGFPNIATVLSGMTSLEMLRENIQTMKDFQPLSAAERTAIDKVTGIFHAQNLIPCTACRYCMEVCPKGIHIPDLFSLMNTRKNFGAANTAYYYNHIHTTEGARAKDCLQCGRCERICPQHLGIRALLGEVSKEFDGQAGATA